MTKSDLSAVSVHDAAEILGVSPRRVRQFIEEGRLKAIKTRRMYLIPRGALRRFAEKPRRDGNPSVSARKPRK